MAQRRFTYPIRFAQAALALVMCVILATGVIADSKSRGSSEDARNNSSARHEVSTRSSPDRSNDRSPAKSTGSTSTTIRRNPTTSAGTPSSVSRTASRTTPRTAPATTARTTTRTTTDTSYSRTGSRGESTYRPVSSDYGRTTNKPVSTDYGRTTYKPSGSDRPQSTYKPAGEDRRQSTYTPNVDTSRTETRTTTRTTTRAERPEQKTGSSWVFGSANRTENARVERVETNRTDAARLHAADDRSDYYPDKPQVRSADTDRHRNIYKPSDRVPSGGGPNTGPPKTGVPSSNNPRTDGGKDSFRPHSPDGRSDHYPDKPEVRKLDLDRKDFKPGDKPDGLRERDNVRPLWKPDGDRSHHDYKKPSDSKINIDIDINFFKKKGYHPPECHKTGFFYHKTHFGHKPLHYGFWVFDHYDPIYCRRSLYFHYGHFPHVFIARLYVRPYISISYCTTRVVHDHGYYLSRNYNTALDYALSDIRNSWLDGRLDLVRNHVYSDRLIDVLIDGEYDYSIYGEEYIEMTWDALDNIQTISFTWEKVRQRTDGAYTAFGKHVYRDSYGSAKTVYVSYTLRNIGGDYVIEEVGSSNSRLY